MMTSHFIPLLLAVSASTVVISQRVVPTSNFPSRIGSTDSLFDQRGTSRFADTNARFNNFRQTNRVMPAVFRQPNNLQFSGRGFSDVTPSGNTGILGFGVGNIPTSGQGFFPSTGSSGSSNPFIGQNFGSNSVPVTGQNIFGSSGRIPVAGQNIFGSSGRIPVTGQNVFGSSGNIPVTGQNVFGSSGNIPVSGIGFVSGSGNTPFNGQGFIGGFQGSSGVSDGQLFIDANGNILTSGQGVVGNTAFVPAGGQVLIDANGNIIPGGQRFITGANQGTSIVPGITSVSSSRPGFIGGTTRIPSSSTGNFGLTSVPTTGTGLFTGTNPSSIGQGSFSLNSAGQPVQIPRTDSRGLSFRGQNVQPNLGVSTTNRRIRPVSPGSARGSRVLGSQGIPLNTGINRIVHPSLNLGTIGSVTRPRQGINQFFESAKSNPGLFTRTQSAGPCPAVPVVSNFELKQYLGRWYEIERYPAPFQSGSCATADYVLNPNCTVTVINSEITRRGALNTIRGLASSAGDPSRGSFIVKFPEAPSGPLNDNEGNYNIVATDYRNYAVVYSCSMYQNLGQDVKIELSWILGRQPQLSDAFLSSLKSWLPRVGIDTSKYIATRQDICPHRRV